MLRFNSLEVKQWNDYLTESTIKKLSHWQPLMSKESQEVLGQSQLKSPKLALFWSLTVGLLGMDRFYLGQTTRGLLKLLLFLSLLLTFWTGFGLIFGLVFVWQVFEFFLIQKAAREVNGQLLEVVLAYLIRQDKGKGGSDESL